MALFLDMSLLFHRTFVAEIRDATQARTLEAAVSGGQVRVERITDPEDLFCYVGLRTVLGSGEAACLTLAERHGWFVASDEKRRFRREATERLGADRVISTPGLLVLAIRAGLLSVDEADAAKVVLEQHRFKMRFASFVSLCSRELFSCGRSARRHVGPAPTFSTGCCRQRAWQRRVRHPRQPRRIRT